MTLPTLTMLGFRVPIHWLGFGLVVGLYALSFFLPAYCGLLNLVGYEAFAMVFMGLFENPIEITTPDCLLSILGFLPNPLLWIGILLLARKRWRSATAAGALALGLGLVWIVDPDQKMVDLQGLHVGYYCWLASMAALLGTGLMIHFLGVYRVLDDRADAAMTPDPEQPEEAMP